MPGNAHESGLPRFDFYPRDWFLGTRDLNREQRGVYVDLLAAMYARGGPLPYSIEDLRSLLGEKSARVVRRIVNELIAKKKIRLVDDHLVNDRVMHELQAAWDRMAASAGGGKAARRRLNSRQTGKAHDERETSVTEQETSGESSPPFVSNLQSDHSPRRDQSPPPSPSPSPLLRKTLSRERKEKGDPHEKSQPRTGSRLPENWEPSPQDHAYAHSLGYDDEPIHEIAEDFRYYWIDGPGRNKTTRDWSKCWQNWCRKDNRRPGSGNQSKTRSASSSPHEKLLTGFVRAASRTQ